MKKLLCLIIIGLFIISMAGVVSAIVPKNVVVGGTIYNEDYSETVGGADVNIECYDESDILTGKKDTISKTDGTYAEEFCESGCEGLQNCDDGNTVIVYAEKDGVGSGTETGEVHDFGLLVDLAIINVTIPEFGLVMGILTLFGAVGIFFFVRKG